MSKNYILPLVQMIKFGVYKAGESETDITWNQEWLTMYSENNFFKIQGRIRPKNGVKTLYLIPKGGNKREAK